MALLSTLVKAIADVEGLDENRVTWIARHCREAGLITQAGRGRGAASMSVTDAANLLIAVNASDGGKDSFQSIGSYRSLVSVRASFDVDYWTASSEQGGGTPLKFLGRTDVKFGAALERLVELCLSTHPAASVLEQELSGRLQELTISFERPRPAVSVSVIAEVDEDDDEPVFSKALDTVFGQVVTPRGEISRAKDRVDKVQITGQTLVSIGRALSN